MGIGPSQSYLARYNGYTLPGYVQEESFDSIERIAEHYAGYADGSLSEYTGLQNKVISLTLKVWEQDYETCKQSVRQAATMLRSKRSGFAPLYVGNSDRYYEAMTNEIHVEKTAGQQVRTLDYQVQFQCKPWVISNTIYQVSGSAINGATTTISTTGRTIDDGGWTYATFKLSGTNITVSGYTATGDFTGYMSISGAVTDLFIDSEIYTASEYITTPSSTVRPPIYYDAGGVRGFPTPTINHYWHNANDLMRNADYQTFVGPGVTNFLVTGAQLCEITYQDRWYI